MCSFVTSSILSRTSLMIGCPGCLCAWSIAFMATWLLIIIRQVRHSQRFLSCLIAKCAAVNSALYTLNCAAIPRYWWLSSFVTELYAAAQFCPLCLNHLCRLSQSGLSRIPDSSARRLELAGGPLGGQELAGFTWTRYLWCRTRGMLDLSFGRHLKWRKDYMKFFCPTLSRVTQQWSIDYYSSDALCFGPWVSPSSRVSHLPQMLDSMSPGKSRSSERLVDRGSA